MEFLIYVFYKFINYYEGEKNVQRQKIYAYLNAGGVIIIKIFSICVFLEMILNVEIIRYYLTKNTALYFEHFYKKYKKKINIKLKEFKNISPEKKRSLDKMFWIYIIGSGIFFFLSLISPLFEKFI